MQLLINKFKNERLSQKNIKTHKSKALWYICMINKLQQCFIVEITVVINSNSEQVT